MTDSTKLYDVIREAGGEEFGVSDVLRPGPLNYGDTVDWSTFTPADFFWSPDVLVLPVTYSNVSGTIQTAANARELIRVFGKDNFVTIHGEKGLFGLALLSHTPWPRTSQLERLATMLTMLASGDQVLLNTRTYWEYFAELRDKAWEASLAAKTAESLAALAPAGVTVNRASLRTDPWIRHGYQWFKGNQWMPQTATSVINARHDEAVRHVARTVLGWEV
ncbi:hypothetical protein [Kutzneria buriramensis]|uniref:Uncharacterized protein n=1 Tax=Kutzneria buriramensis TaxID=1045776 RepID=A0A3E0HCX0_9PSEU|nr:hypothetical protein [Kutzneria buriramensis]REH42700.1 hypothetical protein BCF44_110197 [Kutzneria buriramensis]